MILSVVIALCTCTAMIVGVLAFPKIKLGKTEVDSYWPIAMVGAAAMLLTRRAEPGRVLEALTANTSVNPIKILVLFISMTVLSVFLDETGFFRYLANRALRMAGKNQLRLFCVLYLTVSVLTVFTSNDIIVLTFTPFICYFAKNARISPVPYLVAEFIAANTMSMMFIIGNPTNIYIATSRGIDFVQYFLVMVLPTLAASLVAFGALWLLFRKELKKPMMAGVEKVVIENKLYLTIGLIDLSVCTLLLAVGTYLGLEMWLVSLTAAVGLFVIIGLLAALRHQKPTELGHTLGRAPWQLIPFVLSMFILILGLTENGVTEWIGQLFGSDFAVWKYGVSSFLADNLINNIPMSVLYSPVIEPLSGLAMERATYATVIGSNLGAYLTPIGALAGIMWMSMLKRQQVRFGFMDFVKYGTAVSVPTLAAALIALSVVLH